MKRRQVRFQSLDPPHKTVPPAEGCNKTMKMTMKAKNKAPLAEGINENVRMETKVIEKTSEDEAWKKMEAIKTNWCSWT